jgi:putative membrane protein
MIPNNFRNREYNGFKKNVENNIFYLLISKPAFYLKKLLWRTMLIGGIAFCLNLFVRLLHYESTTIPSAMHSLIGLVIGLLLVFRTNTAYDRWWEGRKVIGSLSQEISLISIRLNLINDSIKTDGIKDCVSEFLLTLRDYLKFSDDGKESPSFHISQKKSISKAMGRLDDGFVGKDMHVNAIYNSLGDILEYSSVLERIKNTPIPLSYVLHIKISILIYLFTLPFGMFHALGLWSTPLVMLVYYIIAGVEIISNEIENPFADDPNDLPTNTLFNIMIQTLWD